MNESSPSTSCPCPVPRFVTVHEYSAPPPSEVRFEFSSARSYERELVRCETCGHFLSRHEVDAESLYEGDYVNANYRDDRGLRSAFERIISLPPERSDNKGRTSRIQSFLDRRCVNRSLGQKKTVLDVGSGLCVFLHEMKELDWSCTALDPDSRAVRHAREVVGVEAHCGDFMNFESSERYDLITFNKVLEHVPNPVEMLHKAASHLAENGVLYTEVPDGEMAQREGFDREEFFIDHLHVFSMRSLAHLVHEAGSRALMIERVREPSTKYTLYAFASPAGQEKI